MSFDTLRLDRQDAVAVLTIDRPPVNALSSHTIDELRVAMLELANDAAIRAVILTGAGEKAFVAGADIKELALQTPTSGRAHALQGQQVFDLVENMGKPVIAAINGFALGGGCELAMACTLRLAADTARLGQPEIKLGLIPGYAGTQRLSRLVGRTKAMELVLRGNHITAAEACEIGLVNQVVPAAELMSVARAWAGEIAGYGPVAVRYAIDAITRGADMPFPQAEAYEATLFGLVASTEDMREGTSAFLEKRQPVFKGR
jgi:enoyl-CoA hydratase